MRRSASLPEFVPEDGVKAIYCISQGKFIFFEIKQNAGKGVGPVLFH
jgi:hypothetical protein